MEALGVLHYTGFTQAALSTTVAVAVLGIEVPRSLGMTDLRPRDVVMGCGRFLCQCAPEAVGLASVMLFSVALRLRGDTEVITDPATAQVWTEIKAEWPILMGADTLLNVQAMLRLLVFLVAAWRMGSSGLQLANRALTAGRGSPDTAVAQINPHRCSINCKNDFVSPLSGAAAVLFLGSMMVRSRMNTQSDAYRLEGPLAFSGALPGFCELAVIPALAALGVSALRNSLQKAGVGIAGAAGFSAWIASKHYLNLAMNPGIDQLFTLAHVLEFFAALAFLRHAVRACGQESSESGKRGRSFLGFVHVLMAFQQALSTYYFLTAFLPSPNLVGAGRPFCILIMSNLMQLAAYLASAGLFFGSMLSAETTTDENDRTDETVYTMVPSPSMDSRQEECHGAASEVCSDAGSTDEPCSSAEDRDSCASEEVCSDIDSIHMLSESLSL